MKKGKKILIISLVVILLILIAVAVFLFLDNRKHEELERQEEEEIINAEENFKKLFLNLEYDENKNGAIYLAYTMEKQVEGKYDVNINIPLLNIETDTANSVNNEINNSFGKKLLEVVGENETYSKYYVDYVAYTNDHIMSLIIKATLKEGSDAQRVLVKTYNYDLKNNKLVSFAEYLEKAGLDKNIIQNQIINYIREKSEATDTALAEQYNLYVRNIRADEYLIENVENYYIGEDGKLYIVFAYGNNNPTETVDVIIVK